MTIKEAVEKYNRTNEKIQEISELLLRINNPLNRDNLILGTENSYVKIQSEDLNLINTYLNEYRGVLDASLYLQFGDDVK